MRAYVTATGAVFGLLVLLHLVRVAVEGTHLVSDPFFLFTTAVAAGLCFWAWRVLRQLGKAP